MLNYPDFRSYERAFQLMAQVAGRAGRKNKRAGGAIANQEHRSSYHSSGHRPMIMKIW